MTIYIAQYEADGVMYSLCSALSYCSGPHKVIVEPQRGTLQVETKLTGENSWYQPSKLVNISNGLQASKKKVKHSIFMDSDFNCRYPSSSQDSGSSSLNIEKPRVDRRKRLVRQFSL